MKLLNHRNRGARVAWAPLLVIVLLSASACGSPDADDIAASGSPEFAPGDSVQVVGRLIDTRCFSQDGSNLHADHPDPVPADHSGEDCAAFCARLGYPVGVTRSDDPDDVMILLSTPQILADYMDRTVRVRAVVRSEGVLVPHRIELRAGEEWVFIM